MKLIINDINDNILTIILKLIPITQINTTLLTTNMKKIT